MALKKRRSHDELRRAALDAARAIVVEDGMAALNIRKVAQATDCAVGSIYNIFEDFDDLEMQLVLMIIAEMQAALFGGPLPDDSIECLRLIGERYLGYAFACPKLWSMMNDMRIARDSPSAARLRDAIRDIVTECERRTASAFAGGRVDATTSVQVLWASVHGIAALGLSGRLGLVSTLSPRVLTDLLLTTFVAGNQRPA
jgi:AcrR family transcriptional regulator